MADLRNIAQGRADGRFQGLPSKEVSLLSDGEDKLVIDVEDEETPRGRRDGDYSPHPTTWPGGHLQGLRRSPGSCRARNSEEFLTGTK